MARYRVPVYSQQTLALCWEACGKMMWHWRHKNLNDYSKKAGDYLKLNKGLTEEEMDLFYKQLGLRSLPHPKGANLRHALRWSPVIFTEIGKGPGHAMVAGGYDDKTRKYTVINPCLVQVVDFGGGPNTCAQGTVPREIRKVDRQLGKYIWYW
jgi:hypothetical protein